MRSAELVKVAGGVNQDGALKRLFREWVIADGIMGEIVKHFES